MANVGKAYVTIIPKAEGISNQISNLITPATTSAGLTGGTKLSQGIAKGINSVGGVVTKFAATSAATIAGIAGSISSKTFRGGFARAMQIDDARAKMNQLGMETEKIMSNVNDSVTGTRYGLNEMAGIAVNFASSGVKAGSEMTGALKSVASVASIAGVDLNHMGAIFNKVSSAGHVTGQVMTQLSYNGINASAALQKHFGKSSEEISKMVSQGEIDFKNFSDAMYEYFGDAALSANSTFSGAMANVGAALSRIGAKFADPVLGKLREVFAGTGKETGGLIKAINLISKALDPLIEKFAEFVGVIGDKVVGAIDTFNNVMENGGSLADGFKAAIADLIPDGLMEKFKSLDPSMQSLITGFGKVGGVIAGVAAGMGTLGGALGAIVPGVGGLLGPLTGSAGAFKLVSKAGSTLFGTISSLIGGGGLGGLSGALSAISGPFGIAAAAITAMFAKSESFRNAVMGLVKTIVSSLVPIIKSLIPPIQQAIGIVMQVAQILGDTLAPIIQRLTPLIGKLISSVGSIVSTLAGSLLPVIQAMIPAVESILSIVGPILEKVLAVVIKVVNGILTVIQPIISKIISFVVPRLTAMVQTVTAILNRVKSVFSTVWGAIGPIVSRAINGIKTVVGGISSIVGKVQSTFNSVKDAITKPINKAKEIFDKVVGKIKSIFPVKLGKICNLSLPKISISGGKAPWGIGGKGKKPSFDISWKSHALGGIFDRRTLLSDGNMIHEFGEAGSEAIVPLDPFWNKLDDWGAKIVDGLSGLAGYSQNNQPVVVSIQVDSVEVARALAQPMQDQLNKMQVRNNRKLGYL